MTTNEIRLTPQEIGQSYIALRALTKRKIDTMRWSLKQHGQLSPVLVAKVKNGYEMVDGFKRLLAALELANVKTMVCQVVANDDRTAKIVMLGHSLAQSGLNLMEQALILRSLHRDEKMSQEAIARALGRHKAWVCRRLQLVTKLCETAQEDIRVGMLNVTTARELTKLPKGNQQQVLDALLKSPLRGRDRTSFVKMYLKAKCQKKRMAMIQNPAGALVAMRRTETNAPKGLSENGQKTYRNILLVERVALTIASFLERTENYEDTKHLQRSLKGMSNVVNLLLSRISTTYIDLEQKQRSTTQSSICSMPATGPKGKSQDSLESQETK